jgi:hypothetical protein
MTTYNSSSVNFVLKYKDKELAYRKKVDGRQFHQYKKKEQPLLFPYQLFVDISFLDLN